MNKVNGRISIIKTCTLRITKCANRLLSLILRVEHTSNPVKFPATSIDLNFILFDIKCCSQIEYTLITRKQEDACTLIHESRNQQFTFTYNERKSVLQLTPQEWNGETKQEE